MLKFQKKKIQKRVVNKANFKQIIILSIKLKGLNILETKATQLMPL